MLSPGGLPSSSALLSRLARLGTTSLATTVRTRRRHRRRRSHRRRRRRNGLRRRKPSHRVVPNHLYCILYFFIYWTRLAPILERKYVRSRPMVNTTRTKEMMSCTSAVRTSPTFRVTPATTTWNSVTPLPAAAAGASRGVMMPSDRAVKNLDTTEPK